MPAPPGLVAYGNGSYACYALPFKGLFLMTTRTSRVWKLRGNQKRRQLAVGQPQT